MLKLDKKDYILIILFFFVAYILRMIYFNEYAKTNIYPLFPYSDGYYYYMWAEGIAHGDIIGHMAFMKWPLYAYLLALMFWLSKNPVFWIYLFQFILGAFNCILIYLIAKLIFNRFVAIVSACLYLSYGMFIFYEGLLIYTSLSLFMNSVLLLIFITDKDNLRSGRLLRNGLLTGILTLLQANIAIFGILAQAWILKVKKHNIVNMFGKFLVYVLGLVIVISAATLVNYLAERDFVPLTGNLGFSFYVGNNPLADGSFSCPPNLSLNQEAMLRDTRIVAEAELGRRLKTSQVSRFWLEKGLLFIHENPLRYARLLLNKLALILFPSDFMPDIELRFLMSKIRLFKILLMDLKYIWPLALLGIFLGVRNFKKIAPLYIMLFSLTMSMIMFFVIAKLRILAVPFLIIFASFSVYTFWEAFNKKEYFRLLALGAALLLIFVILRYNTVFATAMHSPEKKASLAYEELILKALEYEQNHDYLQAIRHLGRAHEINPKDRRAVFRLGVLYFQQQKLDSAIENFKEAIKIDSLCVDAYYNLGLIYNQRQHFPEAKEMLLKAISFNPESVPAHFELGTAYKSLGEKQKARKEFEAALQKSKPWSEDHALVEKELLLLGR